MKIINIKPQSYLFTLKINEKEAKELLKEIDEFKQGEERVRKTSCSKIYMVLCDALEDLGLIPMTEERRKGEKRYPRLDNDEVIVETQEAESSEGEK